MTRATATRALLATISIGIAVFWIWALFFPPKQAVARLDDQAWVARAVPICENANLARNELTDTRRIEDVGPGALAERADLIDQATDIVEAMIDDLGAVSPTGPDDVALLDTWIGYYRQLVVDRRDYTLVLRGGDNPPFPETTVEGSPISEYINDFTVANRMKPCSAPADLAA